MAAAAVFDDGSTLDRVLLGEVIAKAATCPQEQVGDDVIALLGVTPADSVLELGCGSGRLVSQVAARVRDGRVVGIDPFEVMVRHARLRNGRWISAGRADVRQGCSGGLEAFPEGCFDRVFGVHVVYFWRDPAVHLAGIRRVVRRGGSLLLGFWRDDESSGSLRSARTRYAVERVVRHVAEAGFEDVTRIDRSLRGRPFAWVRGRRGHDR